MYGFLLPSECNPIRSVPLFGVRILADDLLPGIGLSGFLRNRDNPPLREDEIRTAIGQRAFRVYSESRSPGSVVVFGFYEIRTVSPQVRTELRSSQGRAQAVPATGDSIRRESG